MSWFNNSWKYRRKIRINKDLITTSLTDFTFLLKMSDGHLAENTKSDGSDIIFTDINDIQLSHEIVTFDKDIGNLVANVKVDVSNSIDTEIFMYYGNESAINSQNKSEANKNFDFVSHLAFDPMTTPIPLDKGPYPTLDRLGTWDIETDQKIDFIDSPVGYGLNFNQLNSQYFRSEKLDFTGAQTLSIEAWIKRLDTGDDRVIAQGYNTDPATQDFNLGIQGSKIMARLRTDLSVSGSRFGNTDITINEWHHVAFIWKANTNSLKIILDGNDDGAFIFNGNNVDCFYQRSFPTYVKTFIGTADDANDRLYNGGMAGVRISANNNYTENHIKLHYVNVTDSNLYIVEPLEVVSGLLLGENLWRSDYIDYLKRLKVFIKKEEIIGSNTHNRFPFLLNLYAPCLNEVSPYGHDVVITDKNGERLPFERMLFRQNINQQRYAAAYLVDYVGTAQQVYDVNAEGTYRAGYLSGIGNFIRFNEVQILNQGIHNLVIRYSNGFGTTSVVDVYVNGVSYLVDMPSTGSWSTYSTVTIPVNWTQQWNTIEIGNTTNCPDIDWIQPLGQETAQLKGFVLLPQISAIEDTEIDIYFKNPAAPIRLNPAYGQPEQTIQAENMTIVSNYQIENNANYLGGVGLRLISTYSVGIATTTFSGVSGYYDVILEVLSESEGLSRYSIRVNGVIQKIFTTKVTEIDQTRMHFVKRRIWINNGDVVEIRSNSSTTAGFGRFGFVRFTPTLLDPNTQWNSEEVWEDYEAVWHLDGTPGESKPFYDYSGKERHLFSYGMTAGVNKINSSIGVGVNFFDNNDKLYGHFDSLNLGQGDFTLSSWVQRSPSLDNNRGILVTDDLNWRFERFERMRILFGGNNFRYYSSEFDVSDRFIYHSTTFNSSTRLREGRVNGNNIGTNTYTNNASGLNDSIAIGYPRNEHRLYANESETFRGIIAEVRIRKEVLSNDWQRNEYKNSIYPQQYINYNTTYCEVNRREFIVAEVGGLVTTISPTNPALYVIPRMMSGEITSYNDHIFATLHFEREMYGEILITSNDIERDFILIRDMTGGLSTQTDTTAGITWTIEFIRFFTGGILSGDVDVNPEANFIPDVTGSVSFGYIDTSHVIDNGFTLEIVFHDAIGGTGFTSGAIINNITRYVDSVSGGFAWTGGIDNFDRESHYYEIKNTGSLYTSGSIVNLFEIHCIPETSFADVKITGTVQDIHQIIYDVLTTAEITISDTAQNEIVEFIPEHILEITSSGTAQLNNVNEYLPDTTGSVGFGSVDTSHIVNIENNLNIVYTENTGRVLTASLETSQVVFIKEVEGFINVVSNTIIEFYPIEDSSGTIIVNGVSQQLNENIYKPLIGGIIVASGTIEKSVSFVYEISNPLVTLVGNAIGDFLLDCFFEDILEITTSGNSWISESVHNIYIEEFTGGIITRSGAFVVVYDSTLIPYDKCVVGRVATTGDFPSMYEASYGDIYYVENNNTSNWWEFKDLTPTDNFIPRTDPFFNTGVLGVYNSIADLPITGNEIGDVWQIGPCHDGVYYVYTENGWEEDTIYPPQIHVERISIVALRTSGTALKETNYKTTEVEVSGELLTNVISIPYSIYNSTLIGGSLHTSGSYDDFLVSANNIGDGLITLTADEIIPIIIRNNEQIVYGKFDGTSVIEVSYEQEAPIVFLQLLGEARKETILNPDLSMDRVVSLFGEVLEAEKVNRICIPIGSIQIGGIVTADYIDYKTVASGGLVDLKIEHEAFIVYGEHNSFASVSLSGSSENKLVLIPSTIVFSELSGENEIDESIYITETLGEFEVTFDSEIESNYYPEVSGSLYWKKDVTANLVIIGETLVAYFTPYGGVRFFGFYLNVNCNYNNIDSEGISSFSGEVLPEIEFGNPQVESSVISISGEVENVIVDYSFDLLLSLSIVDSAEELVEYITDTEIIYLEIKDFTENIMVYTPKVSGEIIVNGEVEENIANFETGDSLRRIVLSGTSIEKVFREEVANSVLLSTSGIITSVVRFNANVSIDRRIQISGTSAPNYYIAINRPFGGRIKTSGSFNKIVSFNASTPNPKARVLGSAQIFVVYPHIITGGIITSGSDYYRFVLYRDFIGGINISGGVDYTSSFQEYRYKVSGGIITSGEFITSQSHLFRILGSGGIAKFSGSADYIHERNHVYNVSGGMTLFGGTTDPTEFYLIIAGQLNAYGTASVRAKYIHEVETETILLSIDGYTEYSELHSFYPQTLITPIVISGEVEEDVIKNYISEIEEDVIIVSGEFEYYDILYYVYEPFGIIHTSGELSQTRIYNYISEQEIPQIIISGEFDYYQDFNRHEVSGGIITSGIDITIEEFECIYKPNMGGVVWSKGIIIDSTNYNEYIKEDFDGSIKLKGTSLSLYSRIFYYEATHSHLGSIRVSGWAFAKPILKSIVEVEKIIVWNPEEISYKIEYIQRTRRPIIRILTSGSIESNINFFFNGFGLIKISGAALLQVSYKSTLDLVGRIITSGFELPRINIEREMEGSILINGIAGGNVNIIPEIQGWIILSGGVETADYVDYGEVDNEIVYLQVITKTLYRDHGELLLQFNEITNRREYEAGIGDNETSTPEDTWTILQNFNDMIEGE